MSRELRTVTTAASARPHFDFTMSILPADRNHQRRLLLRPTWLEPQMIRDFSLFLMNNKTSQS